TTARGKQNARSLVGRTRIGDVRTAWDWFTRNISFTNLDLHGNVGWKPVELITLAVLWGWSARRKLTGAFVEAAGVAKELFGSVAVTSYQGLMGALRSYPQLLNQLTAQAQRLMHQAGSPHWRIGKWLALAVDGTRVSTPRTLSNEQVFGIKNYGSGGMARSRAKWKNKKRRSKKLSAPIRPQIWLTLWWHMGLKMPWCWKSGPSTASEREHTQQLLQSQNLPEFTLFCGDAGFTGYDFWKAILDAGHSFLIRVGGNVRVLRKLGVARQRHGLVYFWPDKVRQKRQPPLTLRLLEFHGARSKVYLVTNVLSQRELSLREAGRLYRLRWGIELQFRTLKQTFGRGKLRSRTAPHALIELDWSLMSLWLAQLYAVKAQLPFKIPPANSSAALALEIIQEALHNCNQTVLPCDSLRHRLSQAVKDDYRRTSDKRARYRPHYKDGPTTKKPIVVPASEYQRRAFRELQLAA
ncbi:MAG TPA: transposase, partial [Nitrospiraceae bacterium]|nr:transposase [Nitrospiraceae bacterium]